jgi:hypothetical protein
MRKLNTHAIRTQFIALHGNVHNADNLKVSGAILEAKNNGVTWELYNLKFENNRAEQWFGIITGIM